MANIVSIVSKRRIFLSAIYIILFYVVASVSSQCTYDYEIMPITKFNVSSTENTLGFTQGNVGGIVSIVNGSAVLQFTDFNQYWYTNLCGPNQQCFESSKYVAVGVVIPKFMKTIKSPLRNDRWILTLSMKSSSGDRHYELRLENFHIDTVDDKGIYYLYDRKGLVNAESIEIRIDPTALVSPLIIDDLAFVQTIPKCLDYAGRNDGFVWKKGSTLMLNEKPFRFISFIVFKMEIYTEREIEDIVKTIATFADGGSKVMKLSPFFTVKGDSMHCSVSDCFITANFTYNELFLKKLDIILSVCRKYEVKVIIPLITKTYEFSAFATMHGYNPKDFYFNPAFFEIFKYFITALVNRTNTINGIRYTEDNTIMAWESGDRLIYYNDPPPIDWFIRVCAFIKSLDSNHLISDYTDMDSPNLMRYLNPYSDILEYEYRFFQEFTLETSQIHSYLPNRLGKGYIIGEYLVTSPDKLDSFLKQVINVIFSNYSGSTLSGLFISHLVGRRESKGFRFYVEPTDFRKNSGIHFPGFDFDKIVHADLAGSPELKFEKIIKAAYRLKIVADNHGEYKEYSEYPIPKLEPPSILYMNSSGRSTQVTFFGAVGATRYKLYRSFNGIQYKLLRDDIEEGLEQDDRVKVTDTDPALSTLNCSQDVYYQMISVRDKYSITSEPITFTINIQVNNEPEYCKMKFSTSTEGRKDAFSFRAEIIAGIAGGIIIVALSAAVILYRRPRKKKEIRLVEVLDKMGSQANSMWQKKTFSVPRHLLLDFKKDLICDVNEVANVRGKGLTSTVIKGKMASTALIQKHGDVPIAIKVMNSEDNDYQYEVSIMTIFPACPFIVKIIGYTENPRSIIMKHYPISLKLLLKSSDFDGSPALRMKIGYDISHGMNVIHKCGVLHLDLKPHNIMVDISRDGSFNCVICDFGFSSVIGSDHENSTGTLVPLTAGLTARYASPELYMQFNQIKSRFNREEDKKIDVYAFAITLYEIVFGIDAWEGNQVHEIRNRVLSGERPIITDTMIEPFQDHRPIIDLIRLCWKQEASSRPTFEYICKVFECDGNTTTGISLTNFACVCST